MSSPNRWLFKSEPSVYSIDDLARDRKTYWEGVRNYQARNFLRDQVKKGDLIFFYHSNAEPSGIAGVMKVLREGYPDPAQFEVRSDYYDSKSTRENPRWFTVKLGFLKKFQEILPLEKIRTLQGLQGLKLLERGPRLSIQPVSAKHWDILIRHTN